MTHEELLQALAPVRLPATMASPGWREGLLVFGLGLILAVALWLLLRPLLLRKPSRRALIRATRGIPPQDRLLRIARILGHLPAPLRPAAYGAAAPPPEAEIERIALRSRGRGR